LFILIEYPHPKGWGCKKIVNDPALKSGVFYWFLDELLRSKRASAEKARKIKGFGAKKTLDKRGENADI